MRNIKTFRGFRVDEAAWPWSKKKALTTDDVRRLYDQEDSPQLRMVFDQVLAHPGEQEHEFSADGLEMMGYTSADGVVSALRRLGFTAARRGDVVTVGLGA